MSAHRKATHAGDPRLAGRTLAAFCRDVTWESMPARGARESASARARYPGARARFPCAGFRGACARRNHGGGGSGGVHRDRRRAPPRTPRRGLRQWSAHARLDFDDTHPASIVHPSVVGLPAALAVGEQLEASWTDVLAAYAIGVETAIRIGAAAQGGFHHAGFHATGIVSHFGAALAAGKLLGLTEVRSWSQSRALPPAPLRVSRCFSRRALGPSGCIRDGVPWRVLPPRTLRARVSSHRRDPTRAGSVSSNRTCTAASLCSTRSPRAWGRPGACSRRPSNHTPCVTSSTVAWRQRSSCMAPSRRRRRGSRSFCWRRIRFRSSPSPRRSSSTPPRSTRRSSAPNSSSRRHCCSAGSASRNSRPQPLSDPATSSLAAKVVCRADPQTQFPRYYSGAVSIVLKDGRELHRRIPINKGAGPRALSAQDIESKFLREREADGSTRAARRALSMPSRPRRRVCAP